MTNHKALYKNKFSGDHIGTKNPYFQLRDIITDENISNIYVNPDSFGSTGARKFSD
jgi:hypothetical protein